MVKINQLDVNSNIEGKRVLLRVDFNVPINDGAITENSRIEKILPTIKFLINKKAKIIIIAHLGRPKGKIVPELKGKVEGISIRVPTPNVSLIEFVFSSSKNLTAEEINNSFLKASKSKLKNILDTNNEPLVSSDFNHNSHSAIVDLSLTKVVANKMAKVSAWYDNEWGFASRMCDLANYFGKI